MPGALRERHLFSEQTGEVAPLLHCACRDAVHAARCFNVNRLTVLPPASETGFDRPTGECGLPEPAGLSSGRRAMAARGASVNASLTIRMHFINQSESPASGEAKCRAFIASASP